MKTPEKTEQAVPYEPRNKYIIVRAVKTMRGGLVMPDQAREGLNFYVVAVGPQVEGINVGDEVMISGKIGETHAPLLGERDLFIIEECWVPYKIIRLADET